MSSARRALAALAATLLLAHATACVIEGSIGRDSDVSTTAAGGSTTTDAGGSSSGDATHGTVHDASSSSSTTQGASATDTTADTTSDGGTTDAPPDACQPSPDDDECATCRKGHCCDVLDECLMHVPCVCMLECVDAGDDAPTCAAHCGTDESILADFHACDVASCGAVCP